MTAAEGFESTTGGGAGGPDRRVQLLTGGKRRFAIEGVILAKIAAQLDGI